MNIYVTMSMLYIPSGVLRVRVPWTKVESQPRHRLYYVCLVRVLYVGIPTT